MALSGPGRSVRAAVGLALVMMLTACGDLRDIGEELGWIKPPAPAAPVVAGPVSLATHWLSPETPVNGAAQAQWTARWWQWTVRFGRDDAPFLDPDGRRCAQHQDGPVWFLAGTDGSFDAVRHCRIPAGRHLFVPLIARAASRGDCRGRLSEAARFATHVTSGLVLLDGRPVGTLQDMRIASGCFDLAGRGGVASDGYWLMLAPLPPGRHQLAIAASWQDGPKRMLQNFRYELEIENEDGTVETIAPVPQRQALRR